MTNQEHGIKWTDFTSNPLRYRNAAGDVVWGCSKVSAGCTNCYAEALAKRFDRGAAFNDAEMAKLAPFLDDKELRTLLTSKKISGQRVFIGDMTDIFGEWVPFELLDKLFAVFALRPDVTWQVLTKRPERMRRYLSDPFVDERIAAVMVTDHSTLLIRRGEIMPGNGFRLGGLRVFPLPNVWLGTSVENQETADARIPQLLQTPAAVRFVSYEPALGLINLNPGNWTPPIGGGPRLNLFHPITHGIIDWVIVGGESGTGARPCDVAWIRSIVQQCKAAGVPAFVKQTGSESRGFCEWEHHDECPPQMLDEHGCNEAVGTGTDWQLRHAVDDSFWPCRPKLKDRKGGDMSEWPEDLRVRQFPEAVR